MEFQEKTEKESLAFHLLRNAPALSLTRSQIARLRHAHDMERHGSKRQRRAADEIAREVQADALRGGAADQALLRGEQLEVFNDAGASRVINRDGLYSLFTSGALTGMTLAQRKSSPDQERRADALAKQRLETGYVVRTLYEDRRRSLKSQAGSFGGPGHSSDSAGVDADRKAMLILIAAKDGSSLIDLEQRLTEQQQAVLARVVGEGDMLFHRSTSGARKRSDMRALLCAIDAATVHFGLLTGGAA